MAKDFREEHQRDDEQYRQLNGWQGWPNTIDPLPHPIAHADATQNPLIKFAQLKGLAPTQEAPPQIDELDSFITREANAARPDTYGPGNDFGAEQPMTPDPGINPDDLGESGAASKAPASPLLKFAQMKGMAPTPANPSPSAPQPAFDPAQISPAVDPQRPPPAASSPTPEKLPPDAPTPKNATQPQAGAQAYEPKPTASAQPDYEAPPMRAEAKGNDGEMTTAMLFDLFLNRGRGLGQITSMAASAKPEDVAYENYQRRQKARHDAAENAHLMSATQDPFGIHAATAEATRLRVQKELDEADPTSDVSKQAAADYAHGTGKDPSELVGKTSLRQIKNAQVVYNSDVTKKREGENRAEDFDLWKQKHTVELNDWRKKFGVEAAERHAMAVFTSDLSQQRQIAEEVRRPGVAAAVKQAEIYQAAKPDEQMQGRMTAWERLHPGWKIAEPQFWSEAETNGRGRTKYINDTQDSDLLRAATKDIAEERTAFYNAMHGGEPGAAYAHWRGMHVAIEKAAGAMNRLTGGGGTREEREATINNYPALGNPLGEGALDEIGDIFTHAAGARMASYGVVPNDGTTIDPQEQAPLQPTAASAPPLTVTKSVGPKVNAVVKKTKTKPPDESDWEDVR